MCFFSEDIPNLGYYYPLFEFTTSSSESFSSFEECFESPAKRVEVNMLFYLERANKQDPLF